MTLRRVGDALDRLEIRYLADGDGSLLAMWERHAVLFALEGPDDEILVMRARPHGTVPAGLGRPLLPGGQRVEPHAPASARRTWATRPNAASSPIYAEIQVPLAPGVHDPLLDEMLDCAAAVTSDLRRLAPRRRRSALARPLRQGEHAHPGVVLLAEVLGVRADDQSGRGGDSSACTPTPRLRVGFHGVASPVLGSSAAMPLRFTAPRPADSLPYGLLCHRWCPPT